VRIAVARSLAELPVGRALWNSLVAATPGSTVFQTYEWFESWWRAFGGPHRLFVMTVWDGEVLAGIAPLMILRRHGLRQLEFVGSANADYQGFILGQRAAELVPPICSYLRKHGAQWDMIVLRNVPTDSPTFALLPHAMRSIGLGITDHERVVCPTLEIRSRPDEVRQMLDGYSFRRRVKQLRRNGELAFTRCTTLEQVHKYLPRYFQQYADERRGPPAPDILRPAEARPFFVSLAESMCPAGWLHFSVLERAGHPIAFHFGFEFDGRLYWYKPIFDLKLARLSPGTVLLAHLIRDALDRGLDELDFTVGAEAFKYRYANTQRINANVRVFRRRWLYLTALGVAWARRTAGSLLRSLRRRRAAPRERQGRPPDAATSSSDAA
jgi:CelD/BcsL family acetyltransferase involved in cellulose biosynthesis